MCTGTVAARGPRSALSGPPAGKFFPHGQQRLLAEVAEKPWRRLAQVEMLEPELACDTHLLVFFSYVILICFLSDFFFVLFVF